MRIHGGGVSMILLTPPAQFLYFPYLTSNNTMFSCQSGNTLFIQLIETGFFLFYVFLILFSPRGINE